jgi:uncharacterized protein
MNPRTPWYRFRWRTLLLFPVGCLLILGYAMFFEETFIFFPSRYPEGDWQPQGFPCEDAWFQAADGTRLHGWYVPHDHPRAVFLYCHGNAGNITHRAEILDRLHHDVGAAVLIFDYRGYGRSEGKPNESGILQDARAARAWLAQREGIAEKDIVLMGQSLGGAVAVDLAARDGAKALILESTFTSLPDVASYHYGGLPLRYLLRTRLDSAAKIGDYHGPLLQTHGDADTIVPHEMGRRLFEAANEPKEFVTIKGRDHNDLMDADYYRRLSRFLDAMP